MLDDLYVLSKLKEFEDFRLKERARVIAELESLRSSPRPVARLVGPKLVKAGAWLERVGASMVRATAQE